MLKRSGYPPFNNCYHFTASTKYRKCVFHSVIRERLEYHIEQIATNLGLTVHALSAAVNHIHVLVQGELEPSRMAQYIFGTSSRLIRKEFPELTNFHKEQLWGGKACTSIKDAAHLNNAIDYIKRHDPEDSRVE
jgi:putative transposase